MTPGLVIFIRAIFPQIMRFVERLYEHTQGDAVLARQKLNEMPDQWLGTEASRAAVDAALDAYGEGKK